MHWHIRGPLYSSAEVFLLHHYPLSIKQAKISDWNSIVLPKTNERQQLLKVVSKMMGTVYQKWSQVAEVRSLLSSDNHY